MCGQVNEEGGTKHSSLSTPSLRDSDVSRDEILNKRLKVDSSKTLNIPPPINNQ